MLQTITISAKRQITIPSKLFEKFNLKKGEKLIVDEINGSISLTPAQMIVEDLAGSVSLPKRMQKKSMDEVIRIAKNEYFRSK